MPDPREASSPDELDRDDLMTAAVEQVARWQDLPGRVMPDEMVEEVPADVVRDPDGGRNPDRDWMLRYS